MLCPERRTKVFGDFGRIVDVFGACFHLLILLRLRVGSVLAVHEIRQLDVPLTGSGFMRAQAFQTFLHDGRRIQSIAVGGNFSFASALSVQTFALVLTVRIFQQISIAVNGQQLSGGGARQRKWRELGA